MSARCIRCATVVEGAVGQANAFKDGGAGGICAACLEWARLNKPRVHLVWIGNFPVLKEPAGEQLPLIGEMRL